MLEVSYVLCYMRTAGVGIETEPEDLLEEQRVEICIIAI